MPPRALIAFVVGLGMASGSAAAVPAKINMAKPAAVAPWVAVGDVGCHWWLSGPDGKSHVASIGQGDGLLLSFSDAVFLGWSEADRPLVELRFDGDPARRVTVEGWPSSGGDGATVGSFGLYLDATARRGLGGARRIELRRDGRTLIDLPLSETPNLAALETCVPPAKREDSDEE